MTQKIWPLPRIEFTSVAELARKGKAVIVHSRGAWEALEGRLRLDAGSKLEVAEATLGHFDQLVSQAEGEIVYAIGGGLAADAGKHIASKKSLPLIIVPTAISVDAFFTPSCALREAGGVRYAECKPADVVGIDLRVIAAAPAHLRAAGICDVLSIATARWDWKYADDQEANPEGMGFIEYADHVARALLRGAIECAAAAGKGDPPGVKQLVDCLALEVQLCNQLGHSRPEEGSEHYFAYAAENHAGSGKSHAELVGPGILAIARIQGQETGKLEHAMRACQIPFDALSPSVIQQTLNELPDYCRKHNLPHGIAHDLNSRLIAKVA